MAAAPAAPRIFASYARSDGKEIAAELRARLQAEGFALWQDLTDMEGGKDWWRQITAVIDQIEYLVLVMTPNALRSKVVRDEWRYGRQQGRCVIPIMGAPDLDFGELAGWMRRTHFVDVGQTEQWDRLVSTLRGPCQATRVPFMVDDLPESFVARPNELGALIALLLDADREEPVAITAALRGAGGYGKTTLARAICHDERIQDAYHDGVLWITLGEDPGDLNGRVADLIHTLTGNREAFATLDAAVNRLREALADRRILIVIDDVWNVAHARPFLQGGRHCARLITTRYTNALPDDARPIRVDAMQTAEAIAMLHPKSAEDKREASALHAELIEAYRAECPDGWPSGPDDGYFFQYLPWHLCEAGRRDEARALAFDYRWLRAKLEADGLPGLIQDFQQLGTDEQARKMAAGLRLSAHALRSNPGQLPGQLLGRFAPADGPEIATLLDSGREHSGCPGLRPVRPTLTPPGGPLIRILTGHSDGVESVAVLPDGRRALSGSFDNTLRLWDLESGAELRRFEDHLNWIGAVAALPDGKRALSGSFDNTLRLWDLESGAELRRFEGHNKVTAVAALPDGKRALSGSYDHTLRLWDLESGAELGRFEGHSDGVESVAGLPDGQRALSGARDGTLRLWDLESGAELRRFEGHSDGVESVALLPDGRRALSGSHDHTLRLWDLGRGAELGHFEGHSVGVESVAVLPDGRRALSGSADHTLRLWNLGSGAELRRLEGHRDLVSAVAVLPDGKRALSGSYDQTLRLWDLESGAELRRFEGHQNWINLVAVLPDGHRALSWCQDNTLRLWDLESGTELGHFQSRYGFPQAMVALLDGKRVLSGYADNTLRLWDLESGAELRRLEGHRDLVSAVAVLPDGKRALSGSYDQTLRLWDLESGAELRRFEGHRSTVTGVAVLRDGKSALSGSFDHTLRLWDLDSGVEIAVFEGDDLYTCCAVTPDGRLAVGGDGRGQIHVLEILL